MLGVLAIGGSLRAALRPRRDHLVGTLKIPPWLGWLIMLPVAGVAIVIALFTLADVSIRRNRSGYWLPFPKFVFGGIFVPLGPWLLLIDLRRRDAPRVIPLV